MSLWFSIWFALAGCVLLVWLIRLRSVRRALGSRVILSSASEAPLPVDPPRVSVVVAAKDEEAQIKACVASLLKQDYPNFEVIAADDRSRDRTPDILRQLADDSGGKLKVVSVASVKDGWFGKNNAMREGVAIATGEWLLFTDADCVQTSTRSIRVAMNHAMETRADILSITPGLSAPTMWEKILQPACAVALMAWFQPRRVNRRHRRTAYANGAFILISRRCYEAIGGHEAVRNRLNEDIFMARLAKDAGFHLRVAENENLYRTRMYGTFAQAWRGWSRIFAGCLGAQWKLAVTLAMVLGCTVLPWASLLLAAAGWLAADPPGRNLWLGATAAWAVNVALLQYTTWRLFLVFPVKRHWSWLYVIGAACVAGLLISAMLKVAGMSKVVWRDTAYRGDRLEETGREPAAQRDDGARLPPRVSESLVAPDPRVNGLHNPPGRKPSRPS